eukprot:jgi/Galph1/2894/GphlegSOOS_G1589.1
MSCSSYKLGSNTKWFFLKQEQSCTQQKLLQRRNSGFGKLQQGCWLAQFVCDDQNGYKRLERSNGNKKKRLFTSEEDDLLIKLREKEKLSWKEIGRQLNRRSCVCNMRYKYKLLNRNGASNFTTEHWKQLEHLVKKHGPNWRKIAHIMKISTVNEVRSKYCQLTQGKKPMFTWLTEQDKFLFSLVSENKDWTEISKMIPGSTPTECRFRYEYLCRPFMYRGPVTEEEDCLLRELLCKFGSDWNRIVEYFPWRTRRTVMKRLQLATISSRRIDENVYFRLNELSGQHGERQKFRWTEEEDLMLIECFILYGRSWSTIARSLFGKSASRCFQRFLYLRKEGKIKVTEWGLEEDKKLVCSVGLYNENWSFISKILKYWSSNEIAARYKELQRQHRLAMLEKMVVKEVCRGRASNLISSCVLQPEKNSCQESIRSLQICWG